MIHFSKLMRKGIGICVLILLFSGWSHAALSDLEGTQGHDPVGGADALEGSGDALPAGVVTPGMNQGAAKLSSGNDEIVCEPGAPCIEPGTKLPLRALPRPFSHLYREAKAAEDGIVQANMPAFKPVYVFARQDVDLSNPADPQGWYQIGRSAKTPEGWMQAKDVLEWKQALLVSYTHPGNVLEGRHPVVMFRDKGALESILDDMDMAGAAQKIYDGINEGSIPDSVVSMEPQRFVDITRQFYVLPILQWSQTEINGDEARLLQLAAAVPSSRGADTLDNPEYKAQAAVGREDGSLKDLKVDLVFVIDTTRSMQPFIDMTRDAVARLTRKFSAEATNAFRFGLVLYRDSLDVAPKLEYLTKNLTPELVGGDALVKLLEEDGAATTVGSVDYAEEAFAGVDLALRSKWRDGALRFVILIGDASSHPKGHKQNTTGKDETDLRREYDDAQVHLFAIHLQDPRAVEDHATANAQFTHLARVRGRDESAIKAVNAADEEEYQALVDHLTLSINNLYQEAIGKTAAAKSADTVQTAATEETASVAEVGKLWEAALIEYMGKEATPPKDIVAWTLDRDLINPADRSLEVRVLVTRQQLSTLAQTLDQVVQALMRAEVTQGQFFEALQSVSGQTMKRPEDIGGAAKLADTGLLPAFIQSLPYKSDILALTEDMFASMTAEQRSKLEWSILAKLEQYRAINEQVDAWFRLNDADEDQDMVYPLHLDYLP